jgi:hypothetical protein
MTNSNAHHPVKKSRGKVSINKSYAIFKALAWRRGPRYPQSTRNYGAVRGAAGHGDATSALSKSPGAHSAKKLAQFIL